jgi:hypothetical protein
MLVGTYCALSGMLSLGAYGDEAKCRVDVGGEDLEK